MAVGDIQRIHRVEQFRQLIDPSLIFHDPQRVADPVVGDEIVGRFGHGLPRQ